MSDERNGTRFGNLDLGTGFRMSVPDHPEMIDRLPRRDAPPPRPTVVSVHEERHPDIVSWFDLAQFHAVVCVREVITWSGGVAPGRSGWRHRFLAASQIEDLEAQIAAVGPVASLDEDGDDSPDAGGL